MIKETISGSLKYKQQCLMALWWVGNPPYGGTRSVRSS